MKNHQMEIKALNNLNRLNETNLKIMISIQFKFTNFFTILATFHVIHLVLISYIFICYISIFFSKLRSPNPHRDSSIDQ